MRIHSTEQRYTALDTPLRPTRRRRWVSMSMPSQDEIIRYLVWSVGKVSFMGINTTLHLCRTLARVVVNVFDSLLCGVGVLERYYDMLVTPQSTVGEPVDITEVDTVYAPLSPSDDLPQLDTTNVVASTDVLASIADRHVLILGATGTGKSTIAQWIAREKSAIVRVYDPDATPDDWQGIDVVGRGGDYDAINSAMACDLKILESRAITRGKKGQKGITDEHFIICEEFPAIAVECPTAQDWMGKISRRGRKPRFFICVLSQSNTVKALGIEGDGQIRENFAVLRLGKFAVAHAKHLKDEALSQWLASGERRALVDDSPLQLPIISSQDIQT